MLTWLQSLNFSTAVWEDSLKEVPVQWAKKNPIFATNEKDAYNSKLLPTYPVVSLYSADPQPDINRRFSGVIYNFDTVGDQVKKVQYPAPYKVSYQIDILARELAHIKQMYMELLLEFDVATNIKYLTAELPDPIKTTYMKLILTDVADNSDLEIDTTGQLQLYRKTVTVEANIWLFKDRFPTLINRIEQVELGYKVDSDVVNEIQILE